jgi:streptogramin lyase
MVEPRLIPFFVFVVALVGCGGSGSQSASPQVMPMQLAFQTLCHRPCVRAEYRIPTAGSGVNDITAGPDGNLWFSEGNVDKIGRITTGGTVSEFKIPPCSDPCVPSSVTDGPDGNLWFVTRSGPWHYIGRIATGGAVSMFRLRAGGGFCHWYYNTAAGITAGPDGNLWFADTLTQVTCHPNKDMNLRYTYASLIDRMTPGGITTEFLISKSKLDPDRITVGPDRNLWFTEFSGDRIGRITTSGATTEFSIPTAAAGPDQITVGPDGNLWFTEYAGNKIGRITPSGVVTEYSIPTASSNPNAITKAPDGNLWFTEGSTNKIGRITVRGTITEFSIPTPNSRPYGITVGTDGSLWFTEGWGNKIGKFAP